MQDLIPKSMDCGLAILHFGKVEGLKKDMDD